MNETIEHMEQQIRLLASDLEAERQFREVTSADNAKLKRKIKDMESHLLKIKDAEKTAYNSLAAENSKLQAQLVTAKQSNIQLKEDNIALKKQITEKDKKICQLDDLETKRAQKKEQEALRKLQDMVSKYISLY